MGLTKLVLRRPVSTVLAILCLIVFGLSSVMKSPLELMPDMNMSMMIVMTVYSGASPDDVSELVTKPIEDRASTLSGLDTISSQSKENMSIVMLKYKYGTDMNDAYDDLKKQMDLAKVELPEDADDPIMLELNTSLKPNVIMAVSHGEDDDLYNYVNNEIVPEFEKLSTAAEVSITGGLQKYIKVELMPEKLKQYGVSMSSIASDIAGSDITYPADSSFSRNRCILSSSSSLSFWSSAMRCTSSFCLLSIWDIWSVIPNTFTISRKIMNRKRKLGVE